MSRSISALATILTLLSSVAGCSNASSPALPTTTQEVVILASTSTSSPPSSTSVEPIEGAPTIADAAAQLVAAWHAKDKAAAAKIATPQAVAGIFAVPDPEMWLRTCSTDNSLPEGGCAYGTNTGVVQINTEHRANGWVVTSVYFGAIDDGGLPPDPGDAPEGPPRSTAPFGRN